MKSIKSKQVKLVQLTYRVNANVDTQKFAVAFLGLYNNVRENKETFLKMEMYYDSRVIIPAKQYDNSTD